MSFSRNKSNAGFSLPEILIVLLTAAILVVLAVPQMTTAFQLNRIQTGASVVSAKLIEAKSLSIKKNKQVSFVLDEVNRTFWIEANSTVIGNVESLPTEIKIKISPDTSATREYITFNSMGAIITTPSSVLPYHETDKLEIPVTVSISGKVAIGDMRSY
jgi:prepilin-type N-terminal cleavage/methylation domain-containing protein